MLRIKRYVNEALILALITGPGPKDARCVSLTPKSVGRERGRPVELRVRIHPEIRTDAVIEDGIMTMKADDPQALFWTFNERGERVICGVIVDGTRGRQVGFGINGKKSDVHVWRAELLLEDVRKAVT